MQILSHPISLRGKRPALSIVDAGSWFVLLVDIFVAFEPTFLTRVKLSKVASRRDRDLVSRISLVLCGVGLCLACSYLVGLIFQ